MLNPQPQKSELSSLRLTHTATLGELEKYKLLVDSIEDYAIFLLDPEGYVRSWNKGAQNIKGYAPDEIIGKHFSVFYMPEYIDAKKPERELKLARKLGRVEDEDWRVRKDGSQVWANVVITALKDGKGELIGFAKITRDLTERKQSEDMLKSNNTLLKKQRAELEILSASKDEFISLASHQLRTPATAVKQLLGMLTQGFVGKVAPEHLLLIERAYEANERQIRIVESLLKIAQLDAGKIVLRPTPVNLHTFLSDLVEEYADIIAPKNQTIALDIKKTTPATILVDEENFRMALGNLVDNASKYSYEGGAILVAARGNDDNVSISVKDSGVGIDPADHKHLFEKFSRIFNEFSGSVGGSGLGLYWVKRVIEMHHGHIDVKAEKPKGSTFTIVLPREVAHA